MKLKILNKTSKEVGSREVPKQFLEPVRSDLIKRAVLALQANNRQPYGAMPKAGMRHSATLSRRRRKYRGSYGLGISRVQRKIMSRRGTRFNWEGAVIPGTKGGRKAHPPKTEKIWTLKINKKERKKAIRSALSATLEKTMVEKRGHSPPEKYPFLVSELESIVKTVELIKILETLGFKKELERTYEAKERAGKGKRRGRRKSYKTGLLIVVSDDKVPVVKAADNIPGVEAVQVKSLNAELLAPGTHPGRITLFTDKAMELLDKEKLFITKVKK